MSCESDYSCEVWTKVKSRSKRRKKTFKFSCTAGIQANFLLDALPEVKLKVKRAEEDVKDSAFYSTLLETLSTSLPKTKSSINGIICYGIGSISDSVTSRFQLGLILLLQKKFNSSVLIYDPIFSDTDEAVLKDLGINLITENDEAKRKVNVGSLIIFPHVPKQLINNFLWANWCQDLTNCFLLCNSFSKIDEDITESELKTDFKYLHQALNLISEYKVVNNFKFNDIFNDLSIHVFQEDKLPLTFEEYYPEPSYLHQLEYIATLGGKVDANNG